MNSMLSAVNLNVTGDETTWDEEMGAHYTEAEGPPMRHSSLEVEQILATPAGENRHRRGRWEWSPFDHLERRRE